LNTQTFNQDIQMKAPRNMSNSDDNNPSTKDKKEITEILSPAGEQDLVKQTISVADKLRPLAKNKTINQIDKFLDPMLKKFGVTGKWADKLRAFLLDPDSANKVQDKIDNQIPSSKGSSGSHAGLKGYTEKDIEDMGLMLYVETDWARSDVEHEAIIQVALNRAKKYGKSVYDVVKPHTGGWNNSNGYAARWQKGQNAIDSDSHPRWPRAKATIIRCLSGNSSIDIGDCLNFLHPNGMHRGNCEKSMHGQNCPGSKRQCVDYNKVFPELNAGVRCIPKWAIHTSDGGTSKTKPKLYGKALVSNGTVGGTNSVVPGSRIASLTGGSVALAAGVRSNNGNESVIAIGDSITVGYGYGSWADYIGAKKYARGGWSSTAIKNKIFYKYIFNNQGNLPKKLIILAGVNNHLSPQKVIDDLGEMARVAQEKSVIVKILTLLPTAGYWNKSKRYPGGDKLSLKRIGIINNWISGESWVSIPGSSHIDTSAMGDSSGKLLNSGDGIHPNSRGQKQLSLIVRRSL